MKKIVRILFYNFCILLILLTIIELIFGGWIKSSNNLNNIGVIRDRKFKHLVQDLYPDSTGVAFYTRDKYGFRGISTFNAPDKIDVLTIGGSTTDQLYIDDSKTWQRVLENNFKNNGKSYTIANAGLDGQSTRGHIKCFEFWFPEVRNLHPKYFIFYIGINDIYSVADNSSHDKVDVKHKNNFENFKSTLKNNSAISNLVRKLIGMIRAKRLDVYHKKIDFKNVSFTENGLADDKLFETFKKENLAAFKKRLQTLISYTRKYGGEIIFVTQPSSKYKFIKNKLWGISEVSELQGFPYNGVDYYYLLSELNKVIYEVAGDEFIVVELTSLPIWEKDDFYDWFHMTPKGARKVGDEIYNQLKNRL